jgi:hypothetical protein
MNATPQSPWKKPWQGPRKVLFWFLLLLVASFIVILLASLMGGPADSLAEHFTLAGLAACGIAIVGFGGTWCVRWLWCWRRFRWVLFGGVCLLTLFALAHAVENWRGHRAWKNFQQLAAAKGERFDVASIIPPPVPDADNFAMAPIFEDTRNEMDPDWRRTHGGPDGTPGPTNRFQLQAFGSKGSSRDVHLGNWMKAERSDLSVWQTFYRTSIVDSASSEFAPGMMVFAERYGLEPVPAAASQPDTNAFVHEFPVAPQPQSPAADVLLALSKFDPVIEELRAASRRPYARFPVRYEEGFNALLPHLRRLREGSHFLAVRAIAALADGNADQALEDVKLSFRLMEATRAEPLLITHLVRIAQTHLALQPIWEGLADQRWNDAQLATIQEELDRLDFLADCHQGMRGERAFSIWAMDYLRRTRDPGLFDVQIGEPVLSGDKRWRRLLFRLAIPRGWFDQNKVSVARIHLELFQPGVDLETRRVSPATLGRLDQGLQAEFTRRTPYNLFSGLLLPALGKAAERFSRSQASVDLARVACALERHRLAQGGYPEYLDALVPQFLAKVPHDVINGQPLKYRRTDDGRFVLYSVGWNETDDGGQLALTKSGNADWNKGDWLWHYPAK